MPTFLDSHFKIQQLESRLSKNQYLSNQCLPNYIDAKVFNALKTCDKIPKRELYPNFYHWYVVMRQFSSRTLQIWMMNKQVNNRKDIIVNQVVELINLQKRVNNEQRKLQDEDMDMRQQHVFIVDNRIQSSSSKRQIMRIKLPYKYSSMINNTDINKDMWYQFLFQINGRFFYKMN